MFECNFCGNSYSKKVSMSNHRRVCKSNPDKIIPYLSIYNRSKDPWNKGLTKETSISLLKVSEKLKENPKGFRSKEYINSDDHKAASARGGRKSGGYRERSGRGISGYYKGIYCQSSWELAFVIYCVDHNLDIQRSNEVRKYLYEGKEKRYFPDFNVGDKIVEVKGYVTEEVKAKQAFNKDIILYDKNKMQPILDYVISSYGKNYVELYEGE